MDFSLQGCAGTSPLDFCTLTKAPWFKGDCLNQCSSGAPGPWLRGARASPWATKGPQLGPRSVCLLPDTQVGETPPPGPWCVVLVAEPKPDGAGAKSSGTEVTSRAAARTGGGDLVTGVWACLLRTALLGLDGTRCDNLLPWTDAKLLLREGKSNGRLRHLADTTPTTAF